MIIGFIANPVYGGTMKERRRDDPLFSACGLNCGLCPNHYTNGASRCSGCGGENFFNPSCAIITCSGQHGGIQHCHLCHEYPCKRYDNADSSDSFVTHKNQLIDNEKAHTMGMEAYGRQLDERIHILQFLLDHFNDERRKNFFCLATNLLDLADIQCVMGQIESQNATEMPIKERAALAVRLFKAMADDRGILLALRKKPKE